MVEPDIPAEQIGAPAVAADQLITGPVAIFDLDRTLHSGSGLGTLARFAFRRRLIGPRRMVHSLLHDVVFQRRGSTDGHISSIAELALDMAAGVSLDELALVITATAESIAESVRPGMRLLLDNHRSADHHCVVLSASPQPLVEEIAALLDVPWGIGTVIEADDERVLTGRIVPPMCYGPGKLERLEQVLGWSRDGDQHVVSFAYADSMSDLPLLESVSSPVVVSPDRRLRRVAIERDWPVIDF